MSRVISALEPGGKPIVLGIHGAHAGSVLCPMEWPA